MLYDLFPYQEEGRKFLASKKRGAIFDQMGLGKTGQAVAASDCILAKRILVLCPAAVLYNWDNSFPKFSYVGLPRKIIRSGKDDPLLMGVTIVSYNMLVQDKMKKKLMAEPWDIIICDESHLLKSVKSKRTKAVYGHLFDGTTGLASKTEYLWLLSGTPMPNNPSELYPMLKCFGLFSGKYKHFVDKFCSGYQGSYDFKITGAKNVSELRALMQKISIRRKTEEVLTDLPPIMHADWTLNPEDCDKEHLNKYLELQDSPEADLVRALVDKEDGVEHGTDSYRWEKTGLDVSFDNLEAARDDSKWPQFDHRCMAAQERRPEVMVSRLFKLTGMAKAKAAADQIRRELESGEMKKVLIFAVSVDVIRTLHAELKDFGAKVIYGGTKLEKRQNHVEYFRKRRKRRVIIANIAAAGTGIDGLQDACNNVVFVQCSWTPSDNAQAAARLHRMGQKRPVLCRYMSLAGSLDEHVTRTLRRKTEMIEQVVD